MITNKLFCPACLLAGVTLFVACQSDPAPAAIDVRTETFAYKRCVRDSLCVEINVAYPVVTSTDAALARRLTDSLQAFLNQSIADASEPTSEPTTLQQHLEKLGPTLLEQLSADFGQDTAITTMLYSVEASYKLLLHAPKYLSAEVSSFMMTGGAHGLGYVALATLHKATGRRLSLSELVSDTIALRPIVEKAFLKANREFLTEGTADAGYEAPDLKEAPLPMPSNFCVVSEGLRVLYNPYETPHGPAEFVLSWKDLDKLAVADKWLK